MDNFMDSSKVGLDYGTPKEGPIPTINRTPNAFTGTNNQEGPNNFDTSTRYRICELGCTNSANP